MASKHGLCSYLYACTTTQKSGGAKAYGGEFGDKTR